MHYGTCEGGPWHKKQMAHHLDGYLVAIDKHISKAAPGIQRTTATETGYRFGEYRWDGKLWIWTELK